MFSVSNRTRESGPVWVLGQSPDWLRNLDFSGMKTILIPRDGKGMLRFNRSDGS